MNGFAEFRAALESWLQKTSLFPDEDLSIDLILNPFAGGLRSRRKARRLIDGLHAAAVRFPPPLWSDRRVTVSSWVTEYPGHEEAVLTHLHAGGQGRHLVVCAGGDGTSRGTLVSALGLPLEQRERLLFVRLPVGTGNDAAETRDWAESLELLSGRGAPYRVEPLPVIEVSIPGRQPGYSFNIASVGLDAFVGDMTNKLKAWFPGNSYALMVDFATLFYERVVPRAPVSIQLWQGDRLVFQWNDAFSLAALGTTGRRTYGAGKRILPDSDNFCMAGKKNLLEKLAFREPVYRGTHRGLPGISFASGTRLKVVSSVRLPLQMDGEAVWVSPSEFPVTFEIQDRGLRSIRP